MPISSLLLLAAGSVMGPQTETFRYPFHSDLRKSPAAILGERKKRTALKPWEQRFDLKALRPEDKLAEETDASGKTWLLFKHAILGNEWDLFIAEKTTEGYAKPLFVGARLDRGIQKGTPTSYEGIPIRDLVKTEWIKVLPGKPSLIQDSDKDGLTDLVEKRLGTDPKKQDTDGDGWLDAVDPCPNAALRTRGDMEKIVAAALEAAVGSWGPNVPAVIEGPPKTKPFEIYGCGEPLLWHRGESELSKVFGGGVVMIHFYGEPNTPARLDRTGKRATVNIGQSFAGLAGVGYEVDLKKVGNDWFVVDMRRTWVS